MDALSVYQICHVRYNLFWKFVVSLYSKKIDKIAYDGWSDKGYLCWLNALA